MHSREHFYDRPPSHDWGPSGHYDDYDMPPRRGPPPPEHDNYKAPHDGYYDHPPPPQYPDDRRPPQDFYHDHHYEDFDRAPPHRPPMNHTRGRGRGQNGGGRGQSYSRGRGAGYSNLNGSKKPIKEEKKEPGSKPAWLSQPKSTTLTSGTNSSKPAWLAQGSTTTTVTSNTSSTKPSSTTPSPSTSSAKPAWLTQSPSTSSTPSSSKPAWLNTSVKTTTNATMSHATTTIQNTATNKPRNNSKPAWLTQSSGIKPIQKSTKNMSNNDSLPPPPPPAYPPPPNQPKVQLVQQHNPYTVTVPSKPVKKVKDSSEVIGTVALPGQKNFISYKNTLQEFCQKKGLSVPSYKSFKNSFGYSATVDIYTGKKVQSSGIQKDRKEAEQCSAFEALKGLGVLLHNSQFLNPSPAKPGAKRQMPTPQTVAKKLKNETPSSANSPNYKCQLNDFCQKFHLPVPTYETTHSVGGFITKLVYNKKEYTSTGPQASKRDAEMNAAQLVLSKVNQAPPPSEPIKGPIVYPNFVAASNNPMGSTESMTTTSDTSTTPTTTVIPLRSMQDLANKNITTVISYKNKLQEACQKRKLSLPTYTTSKDGHLHCCELVLQGQTYTATGCKTKKGSEQSAARVALEALGILNE